MNIKFLPNGPMLISNIELFENGVERASGTVALCRCGLSANKPFCDGSHTGCFEAGGQEMDVEFPDRAENEA